VTGHGHLTRLQPDCSTAFPVIHRAEGIALGRGDDPSLFR